jgi:regulator of nucleoside diphosphate kinase
MERGVARDTGRLPEIIVSKRDFGKLNNMIGDYAPIISWDAVRVLLGELGRARVVQLESVPSTNVTMNSQVEIREEPGGSTRLATLAYPSEQAIYRDAVSVLTPLGTALLGLSAGQAMRYVDTDGQEKTVTVLRIIYQPEARRSYRRAARTGRAAAAP